MSDAPRVSIERHPPERGPQSVVMPSVCCTCCCCCSCCCLTSVGAVVGGVVALRDDGTGVGPEVRRRLWPLVVLAVLPWVAVDLALSLPLVVTLVTLPAALFGAGLVVWLLYAVRVFADPERAQRRALRRYLGYTFAGTVIGLLAMLPILGLL
ncbi:MAG: EI24 domain-containing protein [Myxococcales bacterium]|nr:EI24 domain-containing protein [Myxococcales bacterium]MCB9539537.1 EI24 domain-containing protein [Myxococcales bacterium]